MALPLVQSLEDCASYVLTVEPFSDQLRALPSAVVAAATDAANAPSSAATRLLELYRETNPLVFGFSLSLALGAVFFIASEINGNYSQVDRAWSLLPTAYLAHFAAWARLAGEPSRRLDLALACSVIWSVRLTYNYARKGGYNVGSEDYRWKTVKNSFPSWLFRLFNLSFIAFFQSILLFAFSAFPAYVLLLTSRAERLLGRSDLTPLDGLFAAAQISLVALEGLADQQQWNYQAAKTRYLATAKVPPGCGVGPADLDRGFVAEGLWAYSRHPNFAAEQSIWLVLYQWSCVASGVLYSWAGAGVAVLILLFQGSTSLTERITAGKYPDYANYQRQVGMFVPTSFEPYRSDSSRNSSSTTGATRLTTPTSRARSAGRPKVIRTSELAKKMAEKEAATSAVPLRRSLRKR